jgi:hypothetical protein
MQLGIDAATATDVGSPISATKLRAVELRAPFKAPIQHLRRRGHHSAVIETQ